MARKAPAACPKPDAREASIGQPLEASTYLKCNNVTDYSIFVEGLQNAGLSIVSRLSDTAKDPNQVVVGLESQENARQIVNALNGCMLEDRTMNIKITCLGTRVSKKKKTKEDILPKIKEIRRCVSNAFHVKAFKKDLARGGLKYAVDMQKARTDIKGPSVMTTTQKTNNDSTKATGEPVAIERSGPESNKSKGPGEEICKQGNEEERGDMRDDCIRSETSATQQMKTGETQTDLRDETSHIQDTARMTTSNRSPTPDDFLSALVASLN